MLYNKDFLLKLDKEKHRTTYARITALTFAETPAQTIEGRVTQGSVNIDGSSAIRRSCSLTLVTQDFDFSDFYWGINTKFKLEVGVSNNIDSSYPDIIWFPQGIYVITSLNTSRSTNNFTMTIQGKDKMCLLNGEVSGTLESSVDFGTIEEEDKDGNWTIRSLPIPEIIRNAIHVYGNEPYHNIIINDLDTYGLELLEYRLDSPMYLYRKASPESQLYDNILFDETKECSVDGNSNIKTLGDLTNNELEKLVDPLVGTSEPAKVIIEGNKYYVAKIEYGQTAGYRETDLTYAGDLIANVGESLTSVLDKIKTMLSNFEYFYDLNGRFVFQKKQSVIETLWSPNNSDSYMEETNKYAYQFGDMELFTAFNNNPNLLNLRNDYVIWGERQTVSGTTVPVHMRYAIDRKPTSYTTITVEENNPDLDAYNIKYNLQVSDQKSETFTTDEYDWREIIYRMATDYYKYNILDDFELLVAKANGDLYPSGRTGYEKYYADIQGFWRQLYDPTLGETQNYYTALYNTYKSLRDDLDVIIYGVTNPNGDNNLGGLENYIIKINKAITEEVNELNLYIEECMNGTYVTKYNSAIEIKKAIQYTIFDKIDLDTAQKQPETYLEMLKASYYKAITEYNDYCSKCETYKEKAEDAKIAYNEEFYPATIGEPDKKEPHPHKYWNKAVYEAPETLNFWFDFLDSESSVLGKYDTKNIGFRTKAVNDSGVKSIYFRETPDVIFGEGDLTGYRYIQIPETNIDSMFSISSQGASAKDKLDEMLYQYSYCSESVTITAIPIYHLDANTRIYIHDDEMKIDGDYIVSKITLPLAYNGTMQITATKAAENL